MRYAYTLFEIGKNDDGHTVYRTVEQVPVDPMERDIVDLIRGLRPWARERLSAGWCDLTLYQAIFSRLDEDGEAYLPVESCYLVWEGRTEVAIGADRELTAAGRRTQKI